MTEDLREHLYRCWRKGLSLGESIRSAKKRFGLDIDSSTVQGEFARLSNKHH